MIATGPAPRQGRSVAASPGALLSGVYVSLLVAFAVRFMWPSLFRTWFFNSDEYVVAAEVIRFSQLDFRQHFFDMPGTPLMLLAAALWGVFYGAQCTLGVFSCQTGIGEFTFAHLPALFILLRGLTLIFFCLSVILMFWLSARLMNKPAAWIAALILVMSAYYSSMNTFVRVESLSMSFSLASLLCLVYALDGGHDKRRASRGVFDLVFLAGLLAGLGAATRLHSITATVPVLMLMLVLWPARERYADYPRWAKGLAGLAVLAIAAAAWILWVTWRPNLSLKPHADHLLKMAVAGAGGGVALGFVLYRTRARRVLIRILSPDLIRLLAGCVAGLVLGLPTIFHQYNFFTNSMEMYSTDYVDFTRLGWPFWKNAQWYVMFYLRVAAPDRAVLGLLGVGAACVLLTRDRRVLPFLVGAILFFVSKPLNLPAAPHHVLPWLPFYVIVCSYPVALLFDAVRRRLPYGQAWASAGFVVGFATLAWSMTPGPKVVMGDLPAIEERLRNVGRATSWIKQYTEPQATIAVSFYCFNPDIFYVWTRSLEVSVPPSVFDSRSFEIWWGYASQLKGRAGYACITPSDGAFKLVEPKSPGEATEPANDIRFRRVQSFGAGNNEVVVFRFDPRQ